MESQEVFSSVPDSAPQSDADSQEIPPSPLILLPCIDLTQFIIENYLDILSVVDDTPERTDSGWKDMQDDVGSQRMKKRRTTNIKLKFDDPQKLKFDDPTGLLQIYMPQFFH